MPKQSEEEFTNDFNDEIYLENSNLLQTLYNRNANIVYKNGASIVQIAHDTEKTKIAADPTFSLVKIFEQLQKYCRENALPLLNRPVDVVLEDVLIDHW